MKSDERWNEAEVKKAARIIMDAHKKKSPLIKVLDELVHWMVLLTIVLGNLIISGVIVFLSGLLTQFYLYLIVILFALSFGLMVEIPIGDIEKLSRHKHLITRIMLPVIAMVNILILLGVKSTMEYYLKIDFNINAILAGAIYGFFLIVPHFSAYLFKK